MLHYNITKTTTPGPRFKFKCSPCPPGSRRPPKSQVRNQDATKETRHQAEDHQGNMQASESWKQSPNKYTGKEMGTAEDNTHVYIASFSVDQGKMTEELAQRAAVQALQTAPWTW